MIYMIKYINERIRYYKLDCQKNLFDDFIVINTFGSIHNKSHTGEIVRYYKSKDEAVQFLKEEVIRKQNNNYKIIKDILCQ